MLTTKNADCFLWFQISSKHFLSEQPSSNYPAAEDLLLITERLQFKRQPTSKAVTNDDTCFSLHSLVIYNPKGRVNQFLCKFNSTSDNAALFSNSHKLGIHQPGSLVSNEDSQLLSGSGGGGMTLCQKGAKYKERTRIHQGSEVELIRWDKIVRFSKANVKGKTASHSNPWQVCERQCRNWAQQHPGQDVSPGVGYSGTLPLVEYTETGFTSQPHFSFLSHSNHTLSYTIWGNNSWQG